MDKREFMAWLLRAKPGEKFTYHEGMLSADRLRRIGKGGRMTTGGRRNNKARRVEDMATLVAAAQHNGAIAITQRRVCDGVYQYEAQRV